MGIGLNANGIAGHTKWPMRMHCPQSKGPQENPRELCKFGGFWDGFAKEMVELRSKKEAEHLGK